MSDLVLTLSMLIILNRRNSPSFAHFVLTSFLSEPLRLSQLLEVVRLTMFNSSVKISSEPISAHNFASANLSS
jgi:hypothetical protein